LKVLARAGREDIAYVYIAEVRGNHIEFVESVQPPIPRRDKWVMIVSTMFGCPVGCAMCDAGGDYRGRMTADEILEQIDYMVTRRYPSRRVDVAKFKIQFARMGEPAMNPEVLAVLERLPEIYIAPGLMPSLSTVAPAGTEEFFERLIDVKNRHYPGRFQLQFSIHTTDPDMRDRIIPVKKWGFEEIADYGRRFLRPGDRQVTLNFALAEGYPVDPEVMLSYFSTKDFIIKITPVNPTVRAHENRLRSAVDAQARRCEAADALRDAGYRVILSIGALEENQIGSNCGQYVRRFKTAGTGPEGAYTYALDV